MNRQCFNSLFQFFSILLAMLLTAPTLAQPCNNAIAMTAPNNNYQNNNDGTVTDLQFGLMWLQCSLGQSGRGCARGTAIIFTWDFALQQSKNLNSLGGFAGYSDWRLPNRKELESLVEEACYSPAINLILFPNTQTSFYWSSSPNAEDSLKAWGINFNIGHSGSDHRYNANYVRLVRTIK